MLESLNTSITTKLDTSLLRNLIQSEIKSMKTLPSQTIPEQSLRHKCIFRDGEMEIMHHRMVLIQVFVQLMDLKPPSALSDTLVLQLCKSIHKHDISKITDRKQLMDFMSIY